MPSLRQLLLDTDAALLRVLAARWELDVSSTRARDMAGALATWLGDPQRAASIVERLSQAERDALRTLIANGGSIGAVVFAQRFGSIRPIGPARLERDQPWRAPISPAEGLWYLGLIFRSFEHTRNGVHEVFVAPEELIPLGALLRARELPQHTLPPLAEPSATLSADAMLADDLCTWLAHLLSPSRVPLTQQLRDSNPDRLTFLQHLARRAQLVRPDQPRLDPPPVLAWLGAPAIDQLRGLFNAWADDPEWNDLYHVTTLIPEETGSWSNDPLAARQALLQHLLAALPQTWHSIDALIEMICQQTPDFARGDFDTWYIRDASTGEYLRGFAFWDRVEGALIHYMLTHPLFWMGVVDLNVERNMFHMTAYGAILLGRSDAAPPTEPVARYRVHADATVHIAAARRYDRFQLARIADPISVGDTYLYRLTPASLARARAQKIDAVRIIKSLRQASQAELPPPVEKALRRWSEKGVEATLERTLLLRVKSEAVIKRLQASPKTRNLIGDVVGPAAVQVSEKNWPKLVSALAELGLLVDVHL
jgi:hypothetical protein